MRNSSRKGEVWIQEEKIDESDGHAHAESEVAQIDGVEREAICICEYIGEGRV